MNGFGNLRHILANMMGSFHAPRSASAESAPTVLIVGDPDAAHVAASPDWRLLFASTLADARRLLENSEIPIVVYDREAPGIDWRLAIPALAGTGSRPRVVLLTRTQDSQLWEQVTAAGGYDVIRKPVSAEKLCRAIRAGVSHWRSSRALEADRPRADVR